MNIRTVLETARGIYEKTQCASVGCCGDMNGMLEYLDGAIGELADESYQRGRSDVWEAIESVAKKVVGGEH